MRGSNEGGHRWDDGQDDTTASHFASNRCSGQKTGKLEIGCSEPQARAARDSLENSRAFQPPLPGSL